MATLHIVSRSAALDGCLDVAADGDLVLLIGEAAQRAEHNHGRSVAVLADDVPARILPAADVRPVDYAGFVDLVARHQPIVSWH